MDTAAILLALAVAGVNFGWQPADDGTAGYEYIVQVEPELVDALDQGESIPIESHIPRNVGPIRKVRIVVGRGDVPRTAVEHTANFAGQQGGWTPERYTTSPAANGNYDRYTAPPSLVEQSGSAVSNTASSLTNQVESGLQSAGQQISNAGSRAMSDAQNASQQFGRQLEQWSDDASRQLQSAGNSVRGATEQALNATGNQLRQAENSLGLTGSSPPPATGARGVSAPPWPASAATSSGAPSASATWSTNATAPRGAVADTTSSPGMSMTPTTGGWTSIGSNIAAPPLLNPPIAAVTSSNPNLRVASAGTTAPSFPAPPATTSREPIATPLADPSRQPAATNASANDWGNAWGTGAATTPATIGRAADAPQLGNPAGNSGLVPVAPRYPVQPDTSQASNRWNDPWVEEDPWKQQQQPQQNSRPQTAGSTPATAPAATSIGWPADASNSLPAQTNSAAAPPLVGQAPPATNINTGFAANPTVPGISPAPFPQTGTQAANQGPPTDQLPWVPLLVVSLSLVGSLSANLFLGWSYIDARQKYRSLVRKTADTFRRAAGAAAA